MENVTHALYMAFAVLIFVLALTLSISLLTQARYTSETIISNLNDETYMLVEDDADTSRKVGIETIIPSLYRAFKENYAVRFMESDTEPMYIFKIKAGNNSEISTNVIDISTTNSYDEESNKYKITLGSQVQATKFLDCLISGTLDNFSIASNSTTSYKNLQNKGLYDIITTKIDEGYSFKETLGIYYQEDQYGGSSNEGLQTSTKDANKTERRVITYTLVNNN